MLRTFPTGRDRPGRKGPAEQEGSDRLIDMTGFGSNPGALRVRIHVPGTLAARSGLVVALHGCTQTAAGYDRCSGWSRLADRHGFAVLLPEQRRAKNANLCFNWFEPCDVERRRGENESIAQMVEAAVDRQGLARDRVFVTGLSAGGAMASVMLATRPEVFAGGSIIAGLPYGCASNVQDAFGAMRARGVARGDALAALVRGASCHAGPWPTVSVWHGSADATVHPGNADAIVEQWLPLHGVAGGPSDVETVRGHRREAWRDADGRVVIESYRIVGMGHGAPLDANGPDPTEIAGPHMLDVGLSSTRRMAEFWSLAAERMRSTERQEPTPSALDVTVHGADATSRGFAARPNATTAPRNAAIPAGGIDVRAVIEDALRAGGLIRSLPFRLTR